MDPTAPAAAGTVGPRCSRTRHRHLDAVGLLAEALHGHAKVRAVTPTPAPVARAAEAVAAMAVQVVDVGAVQAVAGGPLGDAVPGVGAAPKGVRVVVGGPARARFHLVLGAVPPPSVRQVPARPAEAPRLPAPRADAEPNPARRDAAVLLEASASRVATARRPRPKPAVVAARGPVALSGQENLAVPSPVPVEAAPPDRPARLVRVARSPVQAMGEDLADLDPPILYRHEPQVYYYEFLLQRLFPYKRQDVF